MVIKMKSLVITCSIVFLFVGSSAAQSWPSPESLLMFLPFDSTYELTDRANDRIPFEVYNAKLETSKPGPFDIHNSSYTISKDAGYICYYKPLPSFPSFTVSLYYYASGASQTGAMVFAYGEGKANRFSFSYNGNALEVHRFDRFENFTSEHFTVENVFHNWTFVALTYDNNTETVKVYNEAGDKIHQKTNFPILDYEGMAFDIGFGRNNRTFLKMHSGDAIACTMIYTKVLSSEEIAQLPEVCRWKGNSPPATTTGNSALSTMFPTMSFILLALSAYKMLAM